MVTSKTDTLHAIATAQALRNARAKAPRDTKHRYVPGKMICRGEEAFVTGSSFFPPGMHPTSPIDNAIGALEVRTDRGSRWFGCDRAYINAELRMVAIGFDARDEVRRTWRGVPKKLRVG